MFYLYKKKKIKLNTACYVLFITQGMENVS